MIVRSYMLILGMSLCCSFARETPPPRYAIHVKSDYFTSDNIGNVYAVKEEELLKFLSGGKFFARYSNLKLGNITNVDATNPLKLVLYYRDFQQIVFLDNQLSLNSEIVSLEKLGYEQTDLVCAAANNGFWIYNKQNNELVRFNEVSKKIASTGNLKQVLQRDMAPNFMIEHNGYLYLNSPETGIYVFDIFGAFSKIVAIKNLRQFQVSENIIYYQRDSSFCSYNHTSFEEACKPVPGAGKITGMKYANNKLFVAAKDSIVVQQL